jgi:hypothetical protein
MKASPVALCVILALGCDTSTEPVGQLAFARDVDNTGLPALNVSRGTIEHRGTFYLPCVPYHTRAQLAERGSGLVEIHIVGELRDGCFTMVSQAAYLARVTALPSGPYTLRVIHSWPQTGRTADTVVTSSVLVP